VLGIDTEKGEAVGSGRSIPEFHLLEALEFMPDLFLRFGGHKQAAGVTLPASRIDEFRDRFNAYAAARLSPDLFCGHLVADAVARLDEITDRSASEILDMAPFGFGNPAPILVLRDVCVPQAPVPFKDKHLRLQLTQGKRSLILKAWDFVDRAAELEPGRPLDVAISVEHDAYSAANGYPPWALTLRDVRESVTEPRL
jgi:single-stranded-DNA-specific exonuclease